MNKKHANGHEFVVTTSEPTSKNGKETKWIDPTQVIPIPGIILTEEAYALIAKPIPQQKQQPITC